MVDLRLITAILTAKIIAFLLHFTGSGATAAPGLIALKIDPGLVIKLAKQLKSNILVSGTNGKTTTTRMISAILNKAGIKHLHNRAGSNLLRGLASTLIQDCSLWGKMSSGRWGLWETDEAVFPIACEQVKPQIVLLTNLFRDQLDRYGEIDTVALGWQKALVKLPSETQVILNSDDATVAGLGKKLKNQVLYFGLNDKSLNTGTPDHASDATVCPRCLSGLAYETSFVGHMGNYTCPKCGRIQPKKQVYLQKVSPVIARIPSEVEGDEAISRLLHFVRNDNTNDNIIKFTTNLPGTYNLYNFCTAVAVAGLLKIEKTIIETALSNFVPAFGRVEKIKVGDKTLHLYLVKNPTGFNEVINTLIAQKQKINCLITINDLIADGKDISWLWDVNFEKLTLYLGKVIVSGTRAFDMALRLKYSNQIIKQSNNLIIEPNLKKAIERLFKIDNSQLYILPTYTAMLEIRKILNQKGLVGSSWKD